MTKPIRVVALGVCRRDGRILVEHGYDRVRDEHYLRAIGGGVEFGERAAEALAREWREELGLELEVGELIGIVENLYTYQGVPGHEVCLVFSARLMDEAAYDCDAFECVEPSGLRHAARWVSLDELRRGAVLFYPRGLLELLGDEPPRSVPHSTWRSAP